MRTTSTENSPYTSRIGVPEEGLGDLAEHRVLRRRGAVEPVQELVVRDVDEELGPPGLRPARVRHTERARLVRDLLRELIRDAAAAVPGDLRTHSNEFSYGVFEGCKAFQGLLNR